MKGQGPQGSLGIEGDVATGIGPAPANSNAPPVPYVPHVPYSFLPSSSPGGLRIWAYGIRTINYNSRNQWGTLQYVTHGDATIKSTREDLVDFEATLN